MTDHTHWERLQSIFHDALELPLSERDAFVRSSCGDDRDLEAEVLAMLRQDANPNGLLEQDVSQIVRQMVDGSPISRKFGSYEIVRVLGEGGMGIVCLAERSDLETQVAIKVLRDAWLSPARRDRFAHEQRTLAQLNHPSIARLYDAAVLADGTPYFVMEYIEGIPLTEYCRNHQLSIELRLRLFRQVLEAVEHAHGNAVIHRDLKPSNILVKNDGSARLLDFGIAKQIENLELGVDQTTTGLRLMTPAYASPEQVRGDRIGISTDVYSLGVILYELLTGKLPFDLANRAPAEAASIIAESNPVKPSAAFTRGSRRNSKGAELSKTARSDLDVLCLTAMHKEPERRYRSVEALIRDVDHYLKAEPLEARPDTWRYRARKFGRRNSSAVASAVFVVLLIIAITTFFMIRLTKARDAALAEAARSQRIQNFMTSLFQGGNPSGLPADDLRVVTLLDRGVQQAQSLGAEPVVQADLYETLGKLYQDIGKLDQANSLINLALSLDQKLYGRDSIESGETLVALGSLRDAQAQLPDAERLVREGLDIEKRHLPPTHPTIARATVALGHVLQYRGSYESAIQILNEQVRLQSASRAPTPELADALALLADAHFYAGHYDMAESLDQRVLPMFRQIYGDRHPYVASILINLAAIRHDRGYYPEAEQFERQGLEIIEQWYGKDNPDTAAALTTLARTLVFERRFEEATALLEQSLAIKERIYGPAHPSIASSLNELGNTAVLQKNYDKAAEYFTRMVDIYRVTYGQHHYLYGVALSNLAGAYAGKEEWKRAEPLFRQAVEIFTETQSAEHINTGIARMKLGRTLLHERRYAEAEVESRAGYEILMKQMTPGASWLINARKDLAEEYAALRQPAQAEKFRNELAPVKALPSTSPSK